MRCRRVSGLLGTGWRPPPLGRMHLVGMLLLVGMIVVGMLVGTLLVGTLLVGSWRNSDG